MAWAGVSLSGCELEALTQVMCGAPGGALLLLSELQPSLAPEQDIPPGQRGLCQTPARKLQLLLSGIEGKIRRSIIKPLLQGTALQLSWSGLCLGNAVRLSFPGNAKNSKRSNQELPTEQMQGTVPAVSTMQPLWAARLPMGQGWAGTGTGWPQPH